MAFKNGVADDMAPIGHSIWPIWLPPYGSLRLAPFGPPSGPCGAPCLAPIWTPSGPHLDPVRPPSGQKKQFFFYFFLFFWGCCCRLEKRGKNISVFNPQDPRAPRALRAKPQEEKGFFGLVPLVTHPSSIPLLGGLTPKFLSLSFHSL
jgi:hypothetical protein